MVMPNLNPTQSPTPAPNPISPDDASIRAYAQQKGFDPDVVSGMARNMGWSLDDAKTALDSGKFASTIPTPNTPMPQLPKSSTPSLKDSILNSIASTPPSSTTTQQPNIPFPAAGAQATVNAMTNGQNPPPNYLSTQTPTPSINKDILPSPPASIVPPVASSNNGNTTQVLPSQTVPQQAQPAEFDPEGVGAPPIPEAGGMTLKDRIMGALKGVGNGLDFSMGQAGYAKDFDFLKRLATGAIDGATGTTPNADGSYGRGISVSPYEVAGAASQTLSPAEQEIQKAMFNRPDLQDLLPNRSLPFIDPSTGNVLYWGTRGANGQIIPNANGNEPPAPGTPEEAAFLNGTSNNGIVPGKQTTSQQTPNAPSTPGITPMAIPATQYNLGIQHSILGNQEDIGKRNMKFGNAYPGDERNKTASIMGEALNNVDQNLIQLDQAGKTGDINAFKAQGQLVLDQLRKTEGVMPRGAQQQAFDQEIASAQSQFNTAISSPNIEALYPAALSAIIKAGTSLRDNIKGSYDTAASSAGVTIGSPDYNKFLNADQNGTRTYTATQKAFVDKDGNIMTTDPKQTLSIQGNGTVGNGTPATPDVIGWDKNGIPQYRETNGNYTLQSVPITYNQDNYIADLKKRANNNNLYDQNSITTMKQLLEGKAAATGEAMAKQSAASKVAAVGGYVDAAGNFFHKGGNLEVPQGRYDDKGNYIAPPQNNNQTSSQSTTPSDQEIKDYHDAQKGVANAKTSAERAAAVSDFNYLNKKYPNFNGW